MICSFCNQPKKELKHAPQAGLFCLTPCCPIRVTNKDIKHLGITLSYKSIRWYSYENKIINIEEKITQQEVIQLVNQVCNDYGYTIPKIKFTKIEGGLYEFNNYTQTITLQDATYINQKIVLHEIAHHLSNCYRKVYNLPFKEKITSNLFVSKKGNAFFRGTKNTEGHNGYFPTFCSILFRDYGGVKDALYLAQKFRFTLYKLKNNGKALKIAV